MVAPGFATVGRSNAKAAAQTGRFRAASNQRLADSFANEMLTRRVQVAPRDADQPRRRPRSRVAGYSGHTPRTRPAEVQFLESSSSEEDDSDDDLGDVGKQRRPIREAEVRRLRMLKKPMSNEVDELKKIAATMVPSQMINKKVQEWIVMAKGNLNAAIHLAVGEQTRQRTMKVRDATVSRTPSKEKQKRPARRAFSRPLPTPEMSTRLLPTPGMSTLPVPPEQLRKGINPEPEPE